VTTSSPTAQLEQAVHSAVLANDRLSVYVLSHNAIPGWASQSTVGPALAQLRASARTRATHGVRVQLLSANYRVLSVQLDPSYLTATALISDEGRVREEPRGARGGGHSTAFDEHARVELRRVRGSQRFIVWRLVST
jgi:hypothetical protein